MRLLGASAFIEAKLNNVYTDKKLIGDDAIVRQDAVELHRVAPDDCCLTISRA
jgi:hypothetical protein